MIIRPVDSDLSLSRLVAERIQRGEAVAVDDLLATIEDLCQELERLRAYADLAQQRIVEAETTAHQWATRVHQAEGRLPLLLRRVQEVWWKHAQGNTITLEEALQHIFRLVGLEGAYKPL